tara:strand:+ start:2356 stop:3399 length:1044 start_codon:yes stop_codon:yes gene_type:complete
MITNDFLSQEYLSTNDVLLKPTQGILKSRSNASVLDTYIYSSPMDMVTGIELSRAMLKYNQAPVFCRFLTKEKRLEALHLFAKDSNFWFSVGSSIDDFDFIREYCLQNNLKLNVSIDVAHGDTVFLQKIYALYSQANFCKGLMSGTIATAASANRCIRSGCTHLRVGIGPGSACSTRIVTGCGVPNLTAVYNVAQEANSIASNIKIIADGGISTSGDIVKYLSAGADAVMLGRLLSSTFESEGWTTTFFRKLFRKPSRKRYRGQASAEFQLDVRGYISGAPEGVQANNYIYPTYSFKEFYYNTSKSIASALSYLGLQSTEDLKPTNVQFIKITNNGLIESKPHLLNK